MNANTLAPVDYHVHYTFSRDRRELRFDLELPYWMYDGGKLYENENGTLTISPIRIIDTSRDRQTTSTLVRLAMDRFCKTDTFVRGFQKLLEGNDDEWALVAVRIWRQELRLSFDQRPYVEAPKSYYDVNDRVPVRPNHIVRDLFVSLTYPLALEFVLPERNNQAIPDWRFRLSIRSETDDPLTATFLCLEELRGGRLYRQISDSRRK